MGQEAWEQLESDITILLSCLWDKRPRDKRCLTCLFLRFLWEKKLKDKGRLACLFFCVVSGTGGFGSTGV